jgi:hypothetical protein
MRYIDSSGIAAFSMETMPQSTRDVTKIDYKAAHHCGCLRSLSARYCRGNITCQAPPPFVQAIHPQADASNKRQALYNLFAAYIHTIPLEELIESVEQARLDAKLRYVVIYGAACSYCLSRAERLEGSYLRTFALELKEQLAQTLAAFVTSSSMAASAPRR